MSSLTLELRPALPRRSGPLVWRLLLSQGDNATGSEGTRPEMVRLLRGTLADKLNEGHKVIVKTFTAAGQLEEHADYQGQSARYYDVPKPEGDGGFGRTCRTLKETDEQRKARQAATRAPKPEPKPKKVREPKPKKVREPKPKPEPKPKKVREPKAPKEAKVKTPPKQRTPRATVTPVVADAFGMGNIPGVKVTGGKRKSAAPPAVSGGEADFDAFLSRVMDDPSLLAGG